MTTRNTVSRRTQYMDAAVVGISAVGGWAFSPWAAGLLATIAAALLLRAVFNIQDPKPEPAWKIAAQLRETRKPRRNCGMDDANPFDSLNHGWASGFGRYWFLHDNDD